MVFSTRATRPSEAYQPELFEGAALYVDTSRSVITKANVVSGTSANLSKSGSTITLSSGAGLVASHAGGTITLAGYAAGNNGRFTMLTATTNGCTFTNAAGSTEAGSGSKSWGVDGQCTGITDLVSGATLTQAGAITTQLAVNTTENSGALAVLAQGSSSGARWLTLDSTAVAGLMNGSGPATWFTYFKPMNFPGTSWTPLQYRDAIVGSVPGSLALLRAVIAADTGRQLVYTTSAGNSTTWGIAAGATTFVAGTWYSLAARYDGATSTDWYIDGAHVVTASSAPARPLVALRSVTIGIFGGVLANLSSAGSGMLAGVGSWKADIGATRIAELHAYYRGWQP